LPNKITKVLSVVKVISNRIILPPLRGPVASPVGFIEDVIDKIAGMSFKNN